jgi:hypothetical protein
VLLQEIRNAPKRLNLLIQPQPQVSGGDPTLWSDSGRFDKHKSRAAYSPAAEMHKVPVIRKSVLSRILAHRRYTNPVRDRYAANL